MILLEIIHSFDYPSIHLHHSNGGVYLGREWDVDLILVAVDSDAHSFLDVRRRDLIAQVDDELGKLLHVDNVLRVVRVCVDDLGATRHLKRLIWNHGWQKGGRVMLIGNCTKTKHLHPKTLNN